LEDVIRVKDQFYVLATSPFADDRTRVLKYGDAFVVLNRFGDIGSVGLGEQGLYHEELAICRGLFSAWEAAHRKFFAPQFKMTMHS